MMWTRFVVILMMMMIASTCLVSADSQKIPDLMGNWTGTYVGHDREGGYNGSSDWLLYLKITEQRDRVFNGTISYKKKSEDKIVGEEGFSGAIGPDMKTVYLGEYDSGFSFGQLIDANTLEIIYLNDGENGSVGVDTFSRD